MAGGAAVKVPGLWGMKSWGFEAQPARPCSVASKRVAPHPSGELKPEVFGAPPRNQGAPP